MTSRCLTHDALSGLRLVLLACALGLPACSGGETRRPYTQGIPDCPAGVAGDLLAPEALQCWLYAAGGRWRIVDRESAHGAAVVQVTAVDPADAGEIGRAIVSSVGRRFSEVLVYVHPEPPAEGPSTTTRIRWTARHGFEELIFSSLPGLD